MFAVKAGHGLVGASAEDEDEQVLAESPSDHLLDLYCSELVKKCGSYEDALEEHLDIKPKIMTVSYDNIDGNSKASDFVLGEEPHNSFHWCSSMIFEDIVSASEISDTKVQPNILGISADARMSITSLEKEHLLNNYVLFLMHLVKTNWPAAFPSMKTNPNIKHQYSGLFEKGVSCWVGPLVCESESTIDGIGETIQCVKLV